MKKSEPRQLRLNRNTVRNLTTHEVKQVGGATGGDGTICGECWNISLLTNTCSVQYCPVTTTG